MPTYQVTSPDGRVFRVQAPDGATQEQVLAYAQANYQDAPASNGPLSAFRQRYPQYNNLADADLAEALRKKFYSSMPAQDYYARLGMPAPGAGEARGAASPRKAKAWREVVASPAYAALSADDREAARNQYFDEVVAPQLSNPSDLQAARTQFDAETGPGRISGSSQAVPSDYESRLAAALRKEDAAGNVEDARALANEIRRVRGDSTPPGAGEVQSSPSIRVSLPNGREVEFPAGTDRAVMEQALQRYWAENNPSGQSTGPTRRGGVSRPNTLARKVERAAFGVLHGDVQAGTREGLIQAGLGLSQLVAQGGLQGAALRKASELLGLPQAPALDFGKQASDWLGQVAAARRRKFERSRAGQNGAGLGGYMVGETAPAMAVPGGAPTMLGRIALGGFGGAVAGASQPVESGDYLSAKAKQTGLGALMGVGGQTLIGEPLRFGAGRLAALFDRSATPNISPNAQAALDYAKINRLPIYPDDLSGNPALRAAGVIVDDVPVLGGQGARRAQSEAARQQAEAMAARFPSQGGNLSDALAASAQSKLARAKGVKNRLYADAFRQLNQSGPIDLPKTRLEAWRLIQQEEQKGTLADKGLIEELGRYLNAPKANFEGWHGARAALGNTISSGRRGENAVLSDASNAVLQRLKGRMDAELGDYANQTAGAGAWRRADTFYRSVMAPYKRGAAGQLLRSTDPDAIANRILGGRDSEAVSRQVYSTLDRNGRAEVRSAMMKQALDRSMQQGEGAEPVFNPGRFAVELAKIRNRTGTFFSHQDQLELKGLENYMGYVRRSGQYAANPPTGRRLIGHGLVLSASSAAGIAGPASYAGGIAALRTLLRTETGRNLLLALGREGPGTRAAENAMQLINSYVQREQAAKYAGEQSHGR